MTRLAVHVVIAPDKFKGTLTAAQVADAVGAGLTANRPDVRVSPVPVADGGDGTLDAALAAGFTRVEATATGPLGDQVSSAIGVRNDVAVVELASASGLVLVPGGQLDALSATSWGTGDLRACRLGRGLFRDRAWRGRERMQRRGRGDAPGARRPSHRC
ncbi:MAG: glycerate kinase [Nocardioidaceae bacterium]